MGYLLNSSSPVDFSEGFTLSAWLRVPEVDDSDFHALFEFGNPAGIPSSITYKNLTIFCDFVGRSFEHTHTDYYIYNQTGTSLATMAPYTTIEDFLASGGVGVTGPGFSEGGNFFRSALGTTDASTATQAASVLATKQAAAPTENWTMETRPNSLYDSYYGSTGGFNWHTPHLTFAQDLTDFNEQVWNHILIACDTSAGIVSQTEVLTGPNDATALLASLTHSCPCYMIANGVTSIDYTTRGGVDGRVVGKTYQFNINFTYNANLNPTGSGIVAAGYPLFLPFNPTASTLGFSVNGSSIETPLAKEYGDFQLWNKFIDPTIPANYAKFVTIKDGVGTPVDPAKARAAFGDQTILFQGKASDSTFFFNRGNGGSFSKVGSGSDFTPAPSY